MSTKPRWKKGRGKLGIFDPLLGIWHADADSPQGKVHCVRSFQKTLNDAYIELNATWHFGSMVYEERCFFGSDRAGTIRFWSFTSDGKQSSGELTDASDIHPEAIAFVAQMPAGIARQIYWPDETEGFHWAVESQTKKGFCQLLFLKTIRYSPHLCNRIRTGQKEEHQEEITDGAV